MLRSSWIGSVVKGASGADAWRETSRFTPIDNVAPLHDRMQHFFLLLLLATPSALIAAGFAGSAIAHRALRRFVAKIRAPHNNSIRAQ